MSGQVRKLVKVVIRAGKPLNVFVQAVVSRGHNSPALKPRQAPLYVVPVGNIALGSGLSELGQVTRSKRCSIAILKPKF